MSDQNQQQWQERYSRQVLFAEIGETGQEQLRQKTVAIVGVGALGTVVAELLTRAGIGRLQLIDRDIVELSNLQRQLLFTQKDIGRSKATAAAEHLRAINEDCTLESTPIHLSVKNCSILAGADVIVDCTDNMTTRFLMNDYCRREKKVWVHGAAIREEGYVFPILAEGPCLRCFVKNSSGETCATVGVLNTTTVMVGTMQAVITMKILLGKKIELLLYHLNAWDLTLKKIKIKQRKGCSTCSGNYHSLDQTTEEVAIVQFCSTGRYQVWGKPVILEEVRQRLEKVEAVISDEETITFRNILLFKDGRALIKAASAEAALAEYSKWIGN